MTETTLTVRGNKSFEDLKQLNDHGAEYWSARELQPMLGYEQWRRFEDAIKRAITSYKQSGNDPQYHFAGAGKMIEVGKEVREAIKRIGGTPPENIPPAEPIREVEKRVKAATPKLELEERDAKGLAGEKK